MATPREASMTSGRDPNEAPPESTRVDLGDDLIEQTRISDPGSPSSSARAFSAEDALSSADILMGEGLYEEAKRLLFRVLRERPELFSAREKLDRLHQEELEQILTESSPPERTRFERTFEHEYVLEKLNQDLKLDVFGAESTEEIAKQFRQALSVSLDGASAQDQIDLGVAFFEMGLFGIALERFSDASRVARRSDPEDARAMLSAEYLQALSLVQMGRDADAIVLLQPHLIRSDLEMEDRVHFMYVHALALERAGRPLEARAALESILAWDPYYRDVRDRVLALRLEQT
jgi:tetratricopeptide (TPR) repeat protein